MFVILLSLSSSCNSFVSHAGISKRGDLVTGNRGTTDLRLHIESYVAEIEILGFVELYCN